MNEAVSARADGGIDVVARGLEEGPDVDAGGVIDADVVRAESLLVIGRQPRDIEYLDEMRDVVFTQHVSVLGGDEGADVQRPCGRMVSCDRGGREHLVHGRAHGLHDLWGDLVEANHG